MQTPIDPGAAALSYTIDDVRSRLHAVDPFAGFDHEAWPFDASGWYGEHSIFRGIVHAVRPQFVVEVGSWKGQSTMNLARALRSLDEGSEQARGSRGILAIDTWLGAMEFWHDHADASRYGALGLQHGYPSVYYQFLANVLHAGYSDIIVPFPTTSTIGARWLANADLHPDLIYVDASHDAPDVDHDIADYWNVLAPGGVLFGDDFDEHWPSVKDAVQAFGMREEVPVAVIDEHYWIAAKAPREESFADLIERIRDCGLATRAGS